jgi:4-diphosphocytidyl-2-C-methyl-D-erythritol kinase
VKSLSLKAPAKVNYRLDVLCRRPDGYHEVRMIMQRIDLCDEVRITLSELKGIRVTCGSDAVPDGPDNIAWRAADALLRAVAIDTGVEIEIVKHIPVAAGLGGGSSDGAAVLMGLNVLLDLGLSLERLMAIGVTIGADVPFFIFGKAALAEGIGERLTALEALPPLWLVLVNPNVHISTAWAYQNLHLTSKKDADIIPRFHETAADLSAILANDLEVVAMGRFPVIREIKERLIAAGAAGALMSGSGSTVFGIFENETAARNGVAALTDANGWFVTAVRNME